MSDSVKYGETLAILNPNNQVVLCGKKRWARWWYLRGGERLSRIKLDCVGNSLIETSFTGQSNALDGSLLFWLVRFSGSAEPSTKRRPGSLLAALDSPLGRRCEALEEALLASPPFRLERYFGTLEAALEFHALVKKRARAKERQSKKMPEKTQELLVELQYWCEQKWGRQTQVARAVGTTPQIVSDWLSGRKKMTGEQTLRVQELLQRERHRRIKF
jgi:hypothetical protein